MRVPVSRFLAGGSKGGTTMKAETAASPTVSEKPKPYMRMAELLLGSRITMALPVVVARGIPDLLGDDAKSAAELSPHAGIPAPTRERLMRALVHLGVFREESEGRFGNTEMSAYLRRGADPSLRDVSLIMNDDALLRAWRNLDRVLQTGEPIFAEVNGQTPFQYFASDPVRSENFAGLMRGMYGPEGPRVAAMFPFGRFGSLIDIGGGAGHILADILRAHPGVRGAVFDLPRTAEVARQFLLEQGLADRASVLEGDFFDAVPSGYDAYFVKSVLHDWNDDRSTAILENCRAAMPAHGRILVTEIVMEPGKPIGHPHRLIDLEMMVSYGGKERTAREFGDLLVRAGFHLEQIHTIDGSFFSVVEGSKA
jgi:O-methyltransferase domain